MDQSLWKISNFIDGRLEKISGAMRNWGRWSDIVAVLLPDILIGVITFEQILPIRVLGLFLFFFFIVQYEAGAYGKKRSQEID